MRKIAIIGAGQSGLILGIGLIDAGYTVTLFSDHSPEEVLCGKPRAFPVFFERTMQIERQLGLDFLDKEFLGFERFRVEVCDSDRKPALVVSSDLEQPWKCVDQRLKFSYWMQEFIARGGELIIKSMTLSHLEECTQNYDLVIVAAGKGELSTLFKRDAKRSTFDKPTRRLAGGLFSGVKRETAERTAKITIFPGIGEIFFHYPFYDKNKNYSYLIAFEAHFGGPMDQFSQVQNSQEHLKLSKKLIQQFMPWEYETVKDMELIENNAWLCGAITPIVREPIGRLPSGASVMGIGDTLILHDPIAGQGANDATKMAYLVTQKIIEHGAKNFDDSWMQAVFEEIWVEAQYSHAFADCLLAPQAHHQEILTVAAQSSEVAKDYVNGFEHPPSLYPWFFVPEATKSYLGQKKYEKTLNKI